jgi:hypothetical protein
MDLLSGNSEIITGLLSYHHIMDLLLGNSEMITGCTWNTASANVSLMLFYSCL